MALVTVTDVKAYAASADVDDTLVTALCTRVSALFASRTDRQIESGPATDTWSGDGGTVTYLKQYPVTALTSVTVDGAAIPAQTPTADGYVYDPNTGRLELVGYTFTKGVANVVVAYTAGYLANAIPDDVKQAAVDQVAYWYKAKDRIGVSNATVAGEAVTYLGGWGAQQGGGGETPLFSATVDRYRRESV